VTTPAVPLRKLLRPYWNRLAVAFAAMLVEGGADLLEPWPLKVVFDYVIGAKPVPAWIAVVFPGGTDPLMLLNIAVLAVVVIAATGALGAYGQRHLSTTVGTRVGYDLRHLLYHHVQRLSLSFHEQRRTGDMVVRLTSDIDAVESFITSALLAIALDLVTLAGLLCVTFTIAHRIATIRDADVIFLLDHGVITECGTHDEPRETFRRQ
jgi:ATP-binding cassette, subfamily B, bacterial